MNQQPCTCRLKYGPGNDPLCLEHGTGITVTPRSVSDIDTAAIRAEWLASNVRPKVIWDLCDALDAARAELAIAAEISGIVATDQRDSWRERALAAESADHATPLFEAVRRAEELTEQRNTWRDRAKGQEAHAEAAEARIAAALALGDTLTSPCDEHCPIDDVRRALTGDTE